MTIGRRFDWRVTTVLLGGTVCTCLQIAASRGQLPLPAVSDAVPLSSAILVPYLVLPAVLTVALGENPLRCLFPGRWRAARGLLVMLASVLVVAAAGVTVLQWPAPFGALQASDVTQIVLTLICVEYFFRGFVVLQLLPRFGWHAVAMAAWPYATVHAGKPVWELFGSVLFGLAAGYLAVRTRSIVYGLALHAAVAIGGVLAATR
jgi:membrane protease YdiL (CAAX protease family)